MHPASLQFGDLISKIYIDDYINEKYEGKGVLTATLQITEDCNLACTYCYQTNKKHTSMSYDTAKKFIDELLDKNSKFKPYCDSYLNRGVILEFIGGEPLLEIELISNITDYFIKKLIILDHPWKNKFRLSICSNGVLYFDPKVQEYIHKHRHHLSLSISIDGNKQLHDTCRLHPNGSGSYDEAIKAAKHYYSLYKLMPGSKFTICPENVNNVSEAIISMISENYREIYLNCVFEDVWNKSHATILYNELKKISDYILENNLEDEVYISILSPYFTGSRIPESEQQNFCGGSGLMLACDYRGDLYPCLRYMPSSIPGCTPYIIGNLTNGIAFDAETNNRVAILNTVTRKEECSQKCYDCPINQGCTSCNALAYQICGTPCKKVETICDMHKARVLAITYLENRTQIKHNSDTRMKVNVPKDWALEIISENEYNMLIELSQGE